MEESQSYPQQHYVTFVKKNSARTGNILFQYMFCKVLSHHFGHKYICFEERHSLGWSDNNPTITITDENAEHYLKDAPSKIAEKNIICDGFFQQSKFYVNIREELLTHLYKCNDYWYGYNGNKEYIQNFLFSMHNQTITNNDIAISLRLDDFIQLPCPTSDILPPTYYMDILESMQFERLYIICDTIRSHWEMKYMEFFSKWSPIFVQGSLSEDCALMRDAPRLIHSNSTLCWIMSFLSTTKIQRYIPCTHFYSGQLLLKIEDTDILQDVLPMKHQEVYDLNYNAYLQSSIYPLSYCIPDECIVNPDDVLKKKTELIAPLIPGQTNTYTFDASMEKDYNEMYQRSLFAHTMKKGGWDCLRHYEILANGCIPIFHDLDKCPTQTLTTFPKGLIQEANRNLRPWNYDNKPLYDGYVYCLLKHMRDHCSASATVRYFLEKMGNITPKNVLLIMGNVGVNYTRETFWIGMKRYIQNLGGVAVEYPKIDFLYDSYSEENKKTLYGNGFTYSRRIADDGYNFTHDEIVDKIKNRFFDLIIYGKVGPDELHEGSHPNMPLWEHVFKRYSKNEIVYLYGGDEAIDMTTNNRYSQHILEHSKYAKCFVRELVM